MDTNASILDAQLNDLIREAREKAGLSQRALGLEVGVKGSTIQKYEDGSLNVSLDTLKAVALATGTEFRRFLEAAGYLSAAVENPLDPAPTPKQILAAINEAFAAVDALAAERSAREKAEAELAELKASLVKSAPVELRGAGEVRETPPKVTPIRKPKPGPIQAAASTGQAPTHDDEDERDDLMRDYEEGGSPDG